MKNFTLGIIVFIVTGLLSIDTIAKKTTAGPYYFLVISGIVQSLTVSSATQEPPTNPVAFSCGNPPIILCAEAYSNFTRTQIGPSLWRLDPAGVHLSISDLYKS